jgi:predicted dinucleotide-binding enzyme
MKIGIIGAGNVATPLARELVKSGHQVKLSNSKGPDTIRALGEKIGAQAVTSEDAVKDVEAIIISIPLARIPDIKGLFTGVPGNVSIIDTSNYYPFRDGTIDGLDDGKPESIWVSEQIGRPVIKAFNAALAHTLDARPVPEGTPGRIALPVAGDDENAKSVALQLVEDAGFDAVDAGSLSDSWRQQPGTPAYCTELNVEELRAALASANNAQAPENRESLIKLFMNSTSPLTHEDVIAMNRKGSIPR